MAYVYLNLNPDKRKTIDCVIRGVSFVTGNDWETTFITGSLLNALSIMTCQKRIMYGQVI